MLFDIRASLSVARFIHHPGGWYSRSPGETGDPVRLRYKCAPVMAQPPAFHLSRRVLEEMASSGAGHDGVGAWQP
jgi:hypothetical protein